MVTLSNITLKGGGEEEKTIRPENSSHLKDLFDILIKIVRLAMIAARCVGLSAIKCKMIVGGIAWSWAEAIARVSM